MQAAITRIYASLKMTTVICLWCWRSILWRGCTC